MKVALAASHKQLPPLRARGEEGLAHEKAVVTRGASAERTAQITAHRCSGKSAPARTPREHAPRNTSEPI